MEKSLSLAGALFIAGCSSALSQSQSIDAVTEPTVMVDYPEMPTMEAIPTPKPAVFPDKFISAIVDYCRLKHGSLQACLLKDTEEAEQIARIHFQNLKKDDYLQNWISKNRYTYGVVVEGDKVGTTVNLAYPEGCRTALFRQEDQAEVVTSCDFGTTDRIQIHIVFPDKGPQTAQYLTKVLFGTTENEKPYLRLYFNKDGTVNGTVKNIEKVKK